MRKSGKKLVSAVMAAAMVLSLAACGGKTADNNCSNRSSHYRSSYRVRDNC